MKLIGTPTSSVKHLANDLRLTETVNLLDSENIWPIGDMSPKYLVRQKGILVDKNNQQIGKQVRDLKKTIALCGNDKKFREKKFEVQEQLQELLADASSLIDLRGICLVFLDSTNPKLWDIIKPILSHDKFEIKYPFVDTHEGITTKNIVVRGWPSVIFCSAKTQSKWSIWPEIASRFQLASPTMIKEKYAESNKLIGQKKGLPNAVYKSLVVSDRDIQLARKCLKSIEQQMKQYDGVWIPYQSILTDKLPQRKGTDVRATKRIFSLLSIVPMIKSNLRNKLSYEGERLVIASLNDLYEVLEMSKETSELPPWKLKWFNKFVVKLWKDKNKDLPDGLVQLTTVDICENYKKSTGKTLQSKNLRDTYLSEFENVGLLEVTRHEGEGNGKSNTYYPIVGDEEHTPSVAHQNVWWCIVDNNKDNNGKSVRKNWFDEALDLLKQYTTHTTGFLFSDMNNNLISKEQLKAQYYVTAIENSVVYHKLLEMGLFKQNEHNLAFQHTTGNLIHHQWCMLKDFPFVSINGGNGKDTSVAATPGSIESINTISEPSTNTSCEVHAIPTTTFNMEPNIGQIATTVQLTRPNSKFDEELLPILDKATGMDLEWSIKDQKQGVYCACFYPVNGQPISLHINDFNNDKIAFVSKIIDTMESFSLVIGHNIMGHDSDLYQLKRMAVYNPGLCDRLDNIPCIDTQKLFEITIVENMLGAMGIDYPSHSLNDIAEAILGKGEGKLHGLTGLDTEDKPPSEQIEYCMQDAKLSVQILQQKDWEVLRVLHSITEPTGMSFLSICNSYSSRLIGNMLDKNGYSNDMTPYIYKGQKIPYEGGFVHQSKIGIHRGVVTVDAKSMYPTIISKFNLSSETINCSHEECREKGKIPIKVMWFLNDGLMKKKQSPILEWWWRCIKEKGIYVKIQNNLMREKDEYKKQGNTIFEKGRKLLANASYGAFQLEHYEFKDQRIGFIITAYGRMIITSLVQQAPKYGFEVIAGDTDPLFLKPLSEKETRLEEFVTYAEEEFKASLEIDKEWNILVVEDEKSYFGLTKQDKLVFKKMWGMRSSNTQLQKELMSKLVNKEILELYIKDPELARQQILKDLRPIFTATQDLQKNQFHFTASKPLNEYDNDGYQREIYLERTEDRLPCSAGTRYSYYKIVPTKINDGNGRIRTKKFTTHPERYTLDTEKIKEGLVNCANTILQLFGIDIRYDLSVIF